MPRSPVCVGGVICGGCVCVGGVGVCGDAI